MHILWKKLFPIGTFSSDRINTNRQIELDLLKAVAVIVMVIDHSVSEISNYFEAEMSLYDNIIFCISQIINASVFMIPMGMSIQYSRYNKANSLALRGFLLLTVGQLLNLLRYILPNLIGYGITGNHFFLNQMACIFSVDILQFAGLCFLLFALLKKMKLNTKEIFLISCGLNAVGMLLNGMETNSYLVNQLLGFFYPTKTESYFPLFNWFIYPAFGYWFGEMYLYVQDKDKLYNRIIHLCLPVTVLYFVMRYLFDFLHLGDLTRLSMLTGVILPDALVIIFVDLIVIGLLYKITKFFKSGICPTSISFIAKHINKYYCISWVLISLVSVILLITHGHLLKNEFLAYLIAITILVACSFLIFIYERCLRKIFSEIPLPIVFALFVGIWGLSITVAAWSYPQITEYPNYLNNYLLDQLGRFF